MKKHRYSVQIRDSGFVLVCVRRFRAKKTAVAFAQRILNRHPTVTTRYGRTPMSWDAAVFRDGNEVAVLEAETVIVKSVGELGWTP